MEWLIVDLETTGLSPSKDDIIEIGAVKIDERGNRTTFQTLVDPGYSLPYEITRLTGITDDMLNGQPSIDEVIDDFIGFMGNAHLIAHNASFDGAFLEPYIGLPKEEWLDTIELSKMAFPMLGSYSLANLTEYFGIVNSEHHRALADAEATADLFCLIEQAFAAADKGVIAAWVHIFSDRRPNYLYYFKRFEPASLCEKYLPPKQDKQEESYDDDDERNEPTEDYLIDKELLKQCFEGDSGLKQYIDGYRPRQSQMIMTEAVADAFNNGEYLLAEAGTGTGKTVAYLLPAIFKSLYGNSRVIVSTHTIHLQDQIIKKDIPELNMYFKGQVSAAILKGRNHYLCYRKWEQEYINGEKEKALFLAHLLPWVVETEDGDGDPLNLNSFERREFQRFSAASENCFGPRCPYFRNRCFVRKARRNAEKANLIVVNHSLLLADSVMGGSAIPKAEYLVIDEAHQLETVAESSLGTSMSFFDHNNLVNEILSVLGKLYKHISLPSFDSQDISLERLKSNQDFLNEIIADIKENEEKGKECFIALKEFTEFYKQNKNSFSRTIRIDERCRLSAHWEEAEIALENLAIWYREIANRLATVVSRFEEQFDEDGFEGEKIRFAVAQSSWCEKTNALNAFLAGEPENNVSWLEDSNERTLYPVMKTAPLRIDEALASTLYETKDSIIFVSATLSVKQHFDYFRDVCGINLIEKNTAELLLPSPFDYEHNSLLLAVNDLPLVGTVSEYEYLESIADAVIGLTAAAKGRSLVLFTSHMHLREVFRRIEIPLKEKGITVLAHEISGSRSTLLKKMREDSKTVILGANSFWEGIDVAGDNLSLLVIVRLPFWPPDMPVIAAKTDRLQQEGRNSFGELSLPQAIIRFKQGFGRLLRKEDDRGIVCVLDKRIYEKRYGSDFVDSLPVEKLYSASVKDIVNLIDRRL